MKNINKFIYEKLTLNKQSKLSNYLITMISDIFIFENQDSIKLLLEDVNEWINKFDIKDADIYMHEKTWNYIYQYNKKLKKNNYIISRDEFEKNALKYENELKTEYDHIGRKFIVLYGKNAFYFEYIVGTKYDDLHSFLIIKK